MMQGNGRRRVERMPGVASKMQTIRSMRRSSKSRRLSADALRHLAMNRTILSERSICQTKTYA